MFVLKRLKEGVHCTKSIKAQGHYTYDASPDPSKTGHFVLCKYFENQRWMDEFMYGHNLDPSDLFDKVGWVEFTQAEAVRQILIYLF